MKTQNPIIGRAKGSAGGMTFCKVYDKNVARAKAFEVNNPKTTAQQTQRDFFAELTALCTDFSEDQLRFLFPQKPKTMSRRNAITKQIAESYTVNGTSKTIDYSDIDTLGNAPVAELGTIDMSISGSNITVEYQSIETLHPELSQNDVVVVLLNSTQKQISLVATGDIVEDGETITALPSNWSETDTVYALVLIANTKNGAGASAGWASMSAIARPARKKD